MNSITHSNFYNFTCKVCDVIRKSLVGAFAFIIATGETAGRARAAAELHRQGYHREAKALILDKNIEDV